MQAMSTIHPIQEFLNSLPESTETWKDDEAMMSTPFSDVATWGRIVVGQLLSGKSFLRGPPGMWEKMEHRLSFVTEPEKTSLYFNSDMLDAWIKAGLEDASTEL